MTKSDSRRKEQSSLAKQSKSAMMTSISHREVKSSPKVKKSFKTLYDECIILLQAGGLSSGFDHLGLRHRDTDFNPSPKQEKNKKAMSTSPSRPASDGITMGTSSTFDRLLMSTGIQKGGALSSTRLQPQLK